MWMMGYNDGGEYNRQDSFNGRNLRPLLPRTIPSPNNAPNSSSLSLSRLHGTEFFALNHHLDQSKREFNAQPAVVVSSRWNPTPEQLRTLEELYRRGTRTPSADQIQHITAQLRRYGKIEGKNVFYWFQNHKARERQKRRRQMETSPHELHRDGEVQERKESGSSYRTGNFEGEETKNWAPSTNCSTLTEGSASLQRSAKAAAAAECRPDGWIQFDEGELQHRMSFMGRNATWQMMQLSCRPPTHLINSTNTTTCTATATTTAITTLNPTAAIATTTPEEATRRTIDPKLIKTHDLMDLFIASSHVENGNINVISVDEDGSCGVEESQTLQLFPIRSNERESNTEKDINISEIPNGGAMTNANLITSSLQFYEFLPLKN